MEIRLLACVVVMNISVLFQIFTFRNLYEGYLPTSLISNSYLRVSGSNFSMRTAYPDFYMVSSVPQCKIRHELLRLSNASGQVTSFS
jgi:hypothetical protein